MIIETIQNLCKSNGTTLTALCKEITGSSGNLPTWKKDKIRLDYLIQIADHFGVTPDYLLGYTNNVKVKHLSVSNFDDISFNSEEISKTTEILSLCEDLSDKDIEFVIKLIELVREYSQE